MKVSYGDILKTDDYKLQEEFISVHTVSGTDAKLSECE